MQPSKSQNTRYQPRALYAVAAILFCMSVAVGVSYEYDLPWLNKAIAMLPSHHYLAWRYHDAAEAECVRTHKPILYFLLDRRDPASMMLDNQCLGDPKIAEMIERDFIPVVFWYDHKQKDYTQTREYRYYQDKLGVFNSNQAAVVAVAPNLLKAKSNDINSSANLAEIGIDDESTLRGDSAYYGYGNYYGGCYGVCGGTYRPYRNGYRSRSGGAICYGYSNKQDFLEFLQSARLWHKLPATVGRVNWQPLDKFDAKKKGSKPKLVAFVQDVGSSSDLLRLNLFWKDRSVDFINKNFDCYLIEFRQTDPAYNKKYARMREQLGISELPALVVLDSPGTQGADPPIEYGWSSIDSSMDFLMAALNPGHGAITLEAGQKNRTGHLFRRGQRVFIK